MPERELGRMLERELGRTASLVIVNNRHDVLVKALNLARQH
jgi:hypothetical protein